MTANGERVGDPLPSPRRGAVLVDRRREVRRPLEPGVRRQELAVIEPPQIWSTWWVACVNYFDDGLRVLGPKCHTVDCADPAVAIGHWPIAPVRCCERCTARSREVADRGLGMHLHVEPLLYTRGGLDDAEQRFALLELT
jgi:hypothetical protein